MVAITALLAFIAVGALWGCTNPLLNAGSKGVEDHGKNEPALSSSSSQPHQNRIRALIAEIVWLVTNIKV